MHSRILAALAGAALAAASVAAASGAERVVKIANGSSSVIVELYVSPPDLGDYGENLLGGAIRIQPGSSARVTFDDRGACAFDFQAVTGDEDMFTGRNIDVCASPDIRLPR